MQVTPKRTTIDNVDMIRPGDHITWQRPSSFWHHAIVTEVISSTELKAVHWKGSGGTYMIEESMDLNVASGEFHLVTYDDLVENSNPSNVVLARPKPDLHETEYNLLVHCKTGDNDSQLLILRKTDNVDYRWTAPEDLETKSPAESDDDWLVGVVVWESFFEPHSVMWRKVLQWPKTKKSQRDKSREMIQTLKPKKKIQKSKATKINLVALSGMWDMFSQYMHIINRDRWSS